MNPFLQSKDARKKFIVLVLRDWNGKNLDVRKHPGEWTVEDGFILDRVIRGLDYDIKNDVKRFILDRRSSIHHHEDSGKHIYVAGHGAELSIGAAVEGRGWKKLDERMRYAIRTLINVETAQRMSGPHLVGPFSVENVLAWIVEGDAVVPPRLRGPKRFGPL